MGYQNTIFPQGSRAEAIMIPPLASTQCNSCVRESLPRNYGLDLFRIFAMFMIVAIHVCAQLFKLGEAASWGTAFIHQVLCGYLQCCVNCFAILTGFLLAEKDNSSFPKLKRLFYIWFEVFFYSILIAAVFAFYGEKTSLHYWYKFLTPVYHHCYWYISAYFGAFVFFSIISYAISRMPVKRLLGFLILLFIFYSLLPTFFQLRNVYNLNFGFSALWILSLAAMGCFLKRMAGEFPKIRYRVLCLFLTVNLVLVLCIALFTFFQKPVPSFLHRLGDCYISPVSIFNSICLLILFYQIKINNLLLQKLILFFSPLTLGVYLIHGHPLIWGKFFWSGNYKIHFTPCGTYLSTFLLLTLGIFFSCSLIDCLRKKIFDWLHILSLCKWLDEKIQYAAEKVISSITCGQENP